MVKIQAGMDQKNKKEETRVTFSEMFHFPERSSKNDKVTKIKSWIKDRWLLICKNDRKVFETVK